MSDHELQNRLRKYRQDYCAAEGVAFHYFYCPILRIDEPCEVMRGHIIPEALGGRDWVPQRKDVDNFYGKVEADFIAAVRDRPKGIQELFFDAAANRQHRPEVKIGGKQFRHYHVKDPTMVPRNHVLGIINDGTNDRYFALKASINEIMASGQTEAAGCVAIEKDYRAAATVSAIKAAHLTCFGVFGYAYVGSPSGLFVASILGDFFRKHRNTDKKDLDKPLREHFSPYYSMCHPVGVAAGRTLPFKGTIEDEQVIHCIDDQDRVFAVGVVFDVGPYFMVVFLPGESRAINTYFAFLKSPPQSVFVGVGPLSPLGGRPETRQRIPLMVEWQLD